MLRIFLKKTKKHNLQQYKKFTYITNFIHQLLNFGFHFPPPYFPDIYPRMNGARWYVEENTYVISHTLGLVAQLCIGANLFKMHTVFIYCMEIRRFCTL